MRNLQRYFYLKNQLIRHRKELQSLPKFPHVSTVLSWFPNSPKIFYGTHPNCCFAVGWTNNMLTSFCFVYSFYLGLKFFPKFPRQMRQNSHNFTSFLFFGQNTQRMFSSFPRRITVTLPFACPWPSMNGNLCQSGMMLPRNFWEVITIRLLTRQQVYKKWKRLVKGSRIGVGLLSKLSSFET